MMESKQVLIFGGTGAIGSAARKEFLAKGWKPVIVSREQSNLQEASAVTWDVLANEVPLAPEEIIKRGPFDAVCWAQGQNLNDSIYDFDINAYRSVMDANVTFILSSLAALLRSQALKAGARLCIVSSIWQDLSRQNKLSYSVSKAAVRGLVLSLANDLAKEGYLVNAVLPGALDTQMTRQNLKPEQIKAIESATQFNRLANLGDVTSAIYYLCSEQNTGVTGQFIKVDLGFSDVRNL